ncbi:MAG: type II toxin-antitoxin system VapC family toxin [Burkholderiales bacterium]
MTRLTLGVLDTSAVLAVLNDEASAPVFLDAFARCDRLVASDATLAELFVVVRARKGAGGVALMDQILASLGVSACPTDARQMVHFRRGFERFGKGIDPAGLNFGDLFSYALAIALDVPLYFQGRDFGKTDVANAMTTLGYTQSVSGEPLAAK